MNFAGKPPDLIFNIVAEIFGKLWKQNGNDKNKLNNTKEDLPGILRAFLILLWTEKYLNSPKSNLVPEEASNSVLVRFRFGSVLVNFLIRSSLVFVYF